MKGKHHAKEFAAQTAMRLDPELPAYQDRLDVKQNG